MNNNKVAPATDKGVYTVSGQEIKTSPEFDSNQVKKNSNDSVPKNDLWYKSVVPEFLHYTVLFILGLLIWGLLWFAWGDNWCWNGPWFRLASVALMAWASGLALQSITTLPPLLAALITGILARHFGYLDMRDFTHIDMFLRKIYPVIILGKGSLGWDTNYMDENRLQIATLGIVPWVAEVATLATCTHFLLGHPWIWGLVFGSFYASVSCPVIMGNVQQVGMSARRGRNWPQFVCTAGGIDTALSVGMYGVFASYLFSDPHDSDWYRYLRAVSSLFLGVALGIAWGSLASLLPHISDTYVVELRVLFVVIGGLFSSFATSYIGWGGVAGVGVLACNATAARYWAKKGWKLNNNPASTAYRVMWSACEPALFAYTGTFFVIKKSMCDAILLGVGILVICLSVRLFAVCLMCWKLSNKQKAYICCIWSTKSIVEAVLCPTIINILLMRGSTPQEMQYAEDIVAITVQEIIITTPLAFLFSKFLGPILIKDKSLGCGNES